MVRQAESSKGLLKRILLVHRNDILKDQLVRCFRTDLQCTNDLAAVDAVEQMAVVDQESWPYSVTSS